MEAKQTIEKTDRGWVDLSNLIYFNSGETVDWDKSIGKTVNFQYDDIMATLTITGRADDIQYVYIDVPGYAQHRRIYVGQIRHGQLGSVVRQITSDFKYEIGDVVNDLLITGRRKVPGYKYYTYTCVVDGYNGEIREDHLTSGHGCPECRKSIGERLVKAYLTKHKIKFLPQYSFDDCRHKGLLYFDFYLPNYNACIEYDGQQHFHPVDFAGKGEEWANEQFQATKTRDEIKTVYCQNHSIPLCRIKYTQNVAKTLDDFFNTLPTQQND